MWQGSVVLGLMVWNKTKQMAAAKIQKVIVTSSQRGVGDTPESPVRIITEIYSGDGNLVGEYDPNGMFTIEDVIKVAKHIAAGNFEYAEGAWNHAILDAGLKFRCCAPFEEQS